MFSWKIGTFEAVVLLIFTLKQTNNSCSQEFLRFVNVALPGNALWKSRCKLPYNCVLFSNKCYYSSLGGDYVKAGLWLRLHRRIKVFESTPLLIPWRAQQPVLLVVLLVAFTTAADLEASSVCPDNSLVLEVVRLMSVSN